MNLTWKLVCIILAVLGGVAFLGYSGTLSSQYVAGVFSAVVTGVITGHFALSTPASKDENS